MPVDDPFVEEKKKLSRWNRPQKREQYSYRIIKLVLEHGSISKSELEVQMRTLGISSDPSGAIRALCSNTGKNYGKIFNNHNHIISIIPELMDYIGENNLFELKLQNDYNQGTENALTSSAYEGGKKVVYSTKYERDPKLRDAAIKEHGYTCFACKFNFKEKYGSQGKDFIHVHHIKPLSETGPTITDVKTDMVVLCANCHAMIHRYKNATLSVDELIKMINDNGSE